MHIEETKVNVLHIHIPLLFVYIYKPVMVINVPSLFKAIPSFDKSLTEPLTEILALGYVSLIR